MFYEGGRVNCVLFNWVLFSFSKRLQLNFSTSTIFFILKKININSYILKCKWMFVLKAK